MSEITKSIEIRVVNMLPQKYLTDMTNDTDKVIINNKYVITINQLYALIDKGSNTPIIYLSNNEVIEALTGNYTNNEYIMFIDETVLNKFLSNNGEINDLPDRIYDSDATYEAINKLSEVTPSSVIQELAKTEYECGL